MWSPKSWRMVLDSSPGWDLWGFDAVVAVAAVVTVVVVGAAAAVVIVADALLADVQGGGESGWAA